MRILLDPGTPKLLRRWLINHEVSTAAEQGGSAFSSLDLIQLAQQRGYEVFISTDVSLSHHPNLQRPGAALRVVHLESVGCFLRTA